MRSLPYCPGCNQTFLFTKDAGDPVFCPNTACKVAGFAIVKPAGDSRDRITGLDFINAVSDGFKLPMDTHRVVIDARVGDLLRVTVERFPDMAPVPATLENAIVENVMPRPVPFAAVMESDGQSVRYESPTLDGLRTLVADAK